MEVSVRLTEHKGMGFGSGAAGTQFAGTAFCNCGWHYEGPDATEESNAHDERHKGGWVSVVDYQPATKRIVLEMKELEPMRLSDTGGDEWRHRIAFLAEARLALQVFKPQSLLSISTA